jgi:hypothetical protein
MREGTCAILKPLEDRATFAPEFHPQTPTLLITPFQRQDLLITAGIHNKYFYIIPAEQRQTKDAPCQRATNQEKGS